MEKVIEIRALVKNSYIPGFRKIASKEKELQEVKEPFQTSKKSGDVEQPYGRPGIEKKSICRKRQF